MDSIFEQFPNWRSQIEQLYLESIDFQELCHDYEEICTLLAIWSGSEEINQRIADEYQMLHDNLKSEIKEDLQLRFGPDLLEDQNLPH